MLEEFRLHIELRAEDLVRGGMDPAEARRTAHLEFGHVETHRRSARTARGLSVVDQIRFSWIDVRLGLRMMRKYPGLTAVAALALALGIPAGLAPAHLARAVDRPLPEDRDDRIRAVRFWNPASRSMGLPTYGDFTLLTRELEGFDQIGAYRNGAYNVGAPDGRASPVRGAEVTASAVAMLQVPPLMGRLIDRADETPGAADVAVIGYRLWQARFAGDPAIVGRTVRIGSTQHTVVGVMPEDFLFPLNDQLWLPLRREASAMPGEGRSLRIVGRLAEGVSVDVAQAEVASVTLPASHPARRGAVAQELEVVPFAYAYVGLPRDGVSALPEFHFFRLLGWVLLLVACGNVAMLIFARTATRFRELAVRTALGAGRWRIVSQVFAETLVLAVLAGGAGLLLVDQVMSHLPWERIAGEAALPYWLDLGVPGAVIPAAALLTVLSATVAGVIP
ncbi:MAG: ABC transporter permease, partial [Planctomycetota bacterium]